MRTQVLALLATVSLGAAPLTAAAAAPPAPTLSAPTGPALAWDFDGDGHQDLVNGRPGHDEGGPGDVVVRYGADGGLSERTLELQHPQAPEGNDAFGLSVASADVDLDGYADLAVGAPSFYLADGQHGSVTVFRGSAGGLSQASATSVIGPRATDGDEVRFGSAVVAARLDADAWPDLAVGAPDSDGDPGPDRSFVAVLRGSETGFSAGASYRVARPTGTRWFGSLLASGDVDGDGRIDLVESSGAPYAGIAHVTWLRGSATGPRGPRPLASGWAASIAVGDVTGDRFADVVLGRPYRSYDNNSRRPYVGAGAVVLHRGSAAGPRPGVTVTQSSPGVPGTEEYRDFFGQSVAVVDVNRNGRREVVVGVPNENVGTVRGAGALNVLRVGALGFRSTGNRLLTQAPAEVPGDLGRFHAFGREISALDVTGDGAPDVIATVPGERSDPTDVYSGLVAVVPVATGPLPSAAGSSYPGMLGYGYNSLARPGSSR